MNKKEIAELAAWTARAIRDTIIDAGRKLDDAGEDIIREYIQACLLNRRLTGQATFEDSARLAEDILARRRLETKTENETVNAIMIFGAKFPAFITQLQRDRDAKAAKLAAMMPAVKA